MQEFAEGATEPGRAVQFEIIGRIVGIAPIARGHEIRDLGRLRRQYGRGRWRKMKGVAFVRFSDGTMARVEVHWYEARTLGRFELKLKRRFS